MIRNTTRRKTLAVKNRVFIGGLFHETHTFVEGKTTLADFQVRTGDAFFGARGDGSPLDGFLEVADEAGWEVIPGVDMRASPGGMVADDAVAFFWKRMRETLVSAAASELSAIFLLLHGAMVSESWDDVEGETLRRIRELPEARDLPIFGVYDLHANGTEMMARHSNCLVVYRENPHIDARESAVRAARLLRRSLEEGTVPASYFRGLPVIWPPSGTGTADDPMRALEARAREFEKSEDVWAVNVNAGFAFADTPDTGVSFSVCGTCGEARATEILDEMCRLGWELREQGVVQEEPVEKVLDRILPVAEGPVVLVEPSDNIGGGAPGDCTGLLRALLDRDADGALVVINDPESAAAAEGAGTGSTVRLKIGGRGSSLDFGPVDLEVEVISTSDGKFDLEDLQSHLASMRGKHIEMGRCAVVRHRGITILLTSRRTAPFDLGQLRSQGIEPEQMKIIGVKAAVAHRRAYDRIAKQMIWVETPGPCSSALSRFPFKKLRRPIYPIDEDAQPSLFQS